jgi:hypothetical protein
MMGALCGRDPKETLWSVFTVLARPKDSEEGKCLITLDKIKAVCKELKVIITICILCWAAAVSTCYPVNLFFILLLLLCC